MSPPSATRNRSVLTPRELGVLTLFSNGYDYKQVAAMLGISVETVKLHRKRFIRKLGARNTANAVYIACSRGVL